MRWRMMLTSCVSVIESQSLKDIEGYKEEYIQALCKQVVIYSLAHQPNKVEAQRHVAC